MSVRRFIKSLAIIALVVLWFSVGPGFALYGVLLLGSEPKHSDQFTPEDLVGVGLTPPNKHNLDIADNVREKCGGRLVELPALVDFQVWSLARGKPIFCRDWIRAKNPPLLVEPSNLRFLFAIIREPRAQLQNLLLSWWKLPNFFLPIRAPNYRVRFATLTGRALESIRFSGDARAQIAVVGEMSRLEIPMPNPAETPLTVFVESISVDSSRHFSFAFHSDDGRTLGSMSDGPEGLTGYWSTSAMFYEIVRRPDGSLMLVITDRHKMISHPNGAASGAFPLPRGSRSIAPLDCPASNETQTAAPESIPTIRILLGYTEDVEVPFDRPDQPPRPSRDWCAFAMELQRVSNEILGGQGSPFSIRIIAPVIQLNQSIARLKAQFTEQLSAIDRILVSDDVPWLRYLQGQISADSELKRFFTTERESHRAAAAILLVGGSLGKYCGISGRIRAQRSSAVAFVQVDCSEANYDLLHELGHLLGARHEWGDQERQNCEKRSATTNLVKENVTDIDSDCEQDYQDVKELRLESIDKATNRAFVQVDDWAQQPYGTIMSANSETKLFYGPTNPPVDRRPYWSSTSAKFVRGVRVSSGKEDNLAAIHKYAKCLADFAGPGPFPEDNAEKICLKVSVPPPASPVPHENCVATNTCQDDIGGLNKLIYFATDQIGFGDVYKAEVDRLAGSLFSQNVPHVYVEGFADSQIVNSKGEEQYNCLLSRERAAAVAHYVHGVFEKLVKDGTPAPTVSCRWWGSKLPTHAMLANSKDAHNRHAKISWNTICDKAASDGRILCDEDFHECPIPSDKWRDELVSTSEDWRLKCRL